MILVLTSVLIVPLRLAFIFDPDTAESLGSRLLVTLDTTLDVLCLVDIVSNFFFGFVTVNTANAKQELVSSWRRICVRYLRRWFTIELLSLGIPPFQVQTPTGM